MRRALSGRTRRRRLAGLLGPAAVLLLGALVPAVVVAAGLRVAVVSDLNSAYGSTTYEGSVAQAVARIVALRPDLVICTGDMVAGQRLHPPLERGAVLAMWSAFHALVTQPLESAGIPFAVTPGNHDASSYAGFAAERAIYGEEWQHRSPGLSFVDRADYPYRYAFAMGDVMFVSLDATAVGALDEDQHRWLADLLAREGARFRHRVVFGHLPIYPFTQGRETEVTADRELERVLAQHGVELYLSGHHHAFYPGFHGGIRHVGQACLGAGPRRLIGSAARAERAVTWLEFGAEAISVQAFSGPALDRPVEFSALPPAIRSRYGTLVRDDLRPGAEPGAAPARAAH